jgi:hypothetical protein
MIRVLMYIRQPYFTSDVEYVNWMDIAAAWKLLEDL